MKQETLNKLATLQTFLKEMTAINNNPYSAGLKTEELLSDLTNYTNDLIATVEKIEEVTISNESEPNTEEAVLAE